jgi:hypothetical protein
MALNPEDGTGVAGADSLVSLARAREIADQLGLAGFPAEDPAAEAALRRGSLWLSSYYRWKGERVKGRGQGQAFPRSGAKDGEGLDIPSDEVPVEVERATVYAAIAEAAQAGVLTPEITPGTIAEMEKVGPLQVKYRTDGARIQQDLSGVDDQRNILTAIYDQVRGLIDTPVFIGFDAA